MNRKMIVSCAALAALSGAASAQLNENFDGYTAGSTIAGQGGWEVWYSGGSDATVSTAQAHSGSNSLFLVPGSDIVHRFNISGGKWTMRAWIYSPSTAFGEAYFLSMNQYETPIDNWSVQVKFDNTLLEVESQFDGATVPIVLDAWTELRVEVNLDCDQHDIYYNGQLLASNLIWTDNVSSNGTQTIANYDLYNFTHDGLWMDDVSLLPGTRGCCPGDLTGSSDPNDPAYGVRDGLVDAADFFYFLDQFVGQNFDVADITGSSDPNDPLYGTPDGFIDAADFFYYLDLFVQNCS